MSFLQQSSFLTSAKHHASSTTAAAVSAPTKEQHGHQPLRSKSSLASLVHLVRNPIAAVGEWRAPDGSGQEERARRQRCDDRKQAEKYEDWQAAAAKLDEIENNNAWKSVFDSADYDPALVEARLKQLDEARISCDVKRMLFLVKTSLTRGLGDMGNLKLYKHTHIGTKDLIERYITSALETLDALVDVSARDRSHGLEPKYILQQVLSARQSFGRSALLLSGGATFGMNHIGVLKALWEARLLPRIISGASAGSIVCAVFCTRTDEEMPQLLENFCHGDLAVFEEEGNEDGILRKVARFLKYGALFDISHLTRVMRGMLGDMTFQEAYNRTRRILNICVSSASLYELPRLLNYVTAPNVLIWSAVAASCSVPLIFSAASLLAKDPRTGEAVPWNASPQRWIDGSVDNDIPMTRLAEMFNVNHFIVSQVNPHVVPFLAKEEDLIAQEAQQSSSTISAGPTWFNSIAHMAKGEALHRMRVTAEMGVFSNSLSKAVSVLSQKYSGDITILPEISFADFPRMLSNPTPTFMVHAMLCGERATWPKLSRVKNHCAIELALDDAVQKLRARVVFSPSQVDLRLGGPAASRVNSEARPGGRRIRGGYRGRRKTSRDSEPDTPTARDIETHLNVAFPREHQKSRSFGTVVLQPEDPPMSLSFSEQTPDELVSSTAHLRFSFPHYDVPSGVEETSNTTTSTETTDNDHGSISLSPGSPASPSSPAFPRVWPTSNQLFPFASQPATPHGYQSGFALLSPAVSTHPSPSAETVTGSPTSPSVHGLLMTPASPPAPSSPERRYKRLFHHTREGMSSMAASTHTGLKRSSSRLKLDISGTRGMVMRKKKPD
ncbi:patatin family [Lasallia pustulata]|uniref:Patatin-like phospholipase domain-containing protein n=1 Tax=Lasallia pustulata TaxID=136370 RepID=A0A1W5DAC4_9LECA|nr:patatin family [Lasallia pustulata]